MMIISVVSSVMADSSKEDFLDLHGPSTPARVKRKEWPNADDLDGTSSSKVGGCGSSRTTLEEKPKELSKEEKKREAARIRQAKSRARKDETQKAKKREEDRIRKAKKKEEMSEDQREDAREKHRQVMAMRRANMPKEATKEKSSKEVESKKKHKASRTEEKIDIKPNKAAQLKMNEKEEKEERILYDEKKKAEEEKTEEEDEDEEDGYWHYMPDCDGYIWVGSGPAPDCSNAHQVEMSNNPWNQTEEQLEEQKKLDDDYNKSLFEWEMEDLRKENEAILNEKRMENEAKLKEKRKQNAESVRRHREKVKAKLQVPVEMPDYEISEYELMRQKNIEEIEKMKKAIGLFDS